MSDPRRNHSSSFTLRSLQADITATSLQCLVPQECRRSGTDCLHPSHHHILSRISSGKECWMRSLFISMLSVNMPFSSTNFFHLVSVPPQSDDNSPSGISAAHVPFHQMQIACCSGHAPPQTSVSVEDGIGTEEVLQRGAVGRR